MSVSHAPNLADVGWEGRVYSWQRRCPSCCSQPAALTRTSQTPAPPNHFHQNSLSTLEKNSCITSLLCTLHAQMVNYHRTALCTLRKTIRWWCNSSYLHYKGSLVRHGTVREHMGYRVCPPAIPQPHCFNVLHTVENVSVAIQGLRTPTSLNHRISIETE